MSRTLKILAVVFGLMVSASVANAQPVSLAADSRDQLIDSTDVTVTGFVVCSSGDTFTVQADVLQNHAGTATIAAAPISGTTDCTGVPQPFAVVATVLIPANGELKKGPATALLAAQTSFMGMSNGSLTITAAVSLVK